MFAVVLALATIMYFFSQGLERNTLTPVVFPDSDEAPLDLEGATTVFVAERLFQRQGELWLEEGLGVDDARRARRLELSPEILEQHPELYGVAQLGQALLRFEGEIVLVRAVASSP